MKKIILLFVFKLMMTDLYSQVIIYKVTGTDVRLLDSIITEAIKDANNGSDVEIRFEAPGLVQLTSYLPDINHTNGSILFCKSPDATTEQGLLYHAEAGNSTVWYGLFVSGTLQTKLRLKNLTFKDFNDKKEITPIWSYYFADIKIDSCRFENNNNAVLMDNYLGNMEITQCTFIHRYNQGFVIRYTGTEEGIVEFLTLDINIHDNQIKLDSGLYERWGGGLNGYGISVNLKRDFAGNGNIKIERNQLYNLGTGISIFNDLGTDTSGNQINPLTAINIRENDLTGNTTGMILVRPFSDWKIEGNNFNNRVTDCEIAAYYPNNKIEFIESGNIFGETKKNAGNIFRNTHSQRSFYLSHSTWKSIIKIEGLELNSHVCIADAGNAIVRDSRIQSNLAIQKPIDRQECDAKQIVADIQKPVLNQAELSGTMFKVNYKVNGLKTTAGDFVLDFYHSNKNGDLKVYLGGHTIQRDGIYVTEFSLPAGINLISGDIIAGTVTSLGNNGYDTLMGTSEAAYLSVTSLICDPKVTVNLNVIISDTSQPAKFHFLLGTLPDISDVMDQKGKIVLANGKYSLTYNGMLFPINNNRIETSFVLNETQYEFLQYVTVFSENSGGIKARIGTFKIK